MVWLRTVDPSQRLPRWAAYTGKCGATKVHMQSFEGLHWCGQSQFAGAHHWAVHQAGDGGRQAAVHAGNDDHNVCGAHGRQVLHYACEPVVDAQVLQQNTPLRCTSAKCAKGWIY